VVEHSLGKGEVLSSILSGSTVNIAVGMGALDCGMLKTKKAWQALRV
jgi:hypothetical protein